MIVLTPEVIKYHLSVTIDMMRNCIQLDAALFIVTFCFNLSVLVCAVLYYGMCSTVQCCVY